MTIKNQREIVLTFSAELIGRVKYFQGLSFDYLSYLSVINNRFSFTARMDAEADRSLKQLIVYLIVMYSDQILTYRRGEYIFDQRLRSMMSIGFGGHITASDGLKFPDLYINAIKRELNEELSIQGKYDYVPVAAINDDSNEVGKVHFGLVSVVFINDPIFKHVDPSILDIEFAPIESIVNNIDNYESWSRICASNISEIVSCAHNLK